MSNLEEEIKEIEEILEKYKVKNYYTIRLREEIRKIQKYQKEEFKEKKKIFNNKYKLLKIY